MEVERKSILMMMMISGEKVVSEKIIDIEIDIEIQD
jgi:hypothetical protein